VIKEFEYFAPKTVAEACSLLSQYKEEAKMIAGGQSLLILMWQGLVAPEYVIDIKGISDLDYINFDDKEGLRIGALTTHRAIEKSPLIRNGFKVLSEMELMLATVQTRNWGTIGGNLCHADPAGDPAPPLIAMNARVKMVGSGGERVAALEDFSKDFFETILQADEMLTEIQVPKPPPNTGTAYMKFALMEGDSAIVGAAASITLEPGGGVCKDARIVLGGVAPVPLRVKRAEQVLVGKKVAEELMAEAAQVAAEEARPTSDMHASAEYRRELVRVFVRRAARQALERASKA
jgi:CO/xanthine dehydrogenase FAD-binding subunit